MSQDEIGVPLQGWRTRRSQIGRHAGAQKIGHEELELGDLEREVIVNCDRSPSRRGPRPLHRAAVGCVRNWAEFEPNAITCLEPMLVKLIRCWLNTFCVNGS